MHLSDEDKELLEASDDYEKACEVANRQAEYFLQRPETYPHLWPEKSGYYRARLINLLRDILAHERRKR